LLRFPGFDAKLNYLVTGLPLTQIADTVQTCMEFVPENDPSLPGLLDRLNATPTSGLVVRVQQVDGKPTPFGFMVEIRLFPLG
jgi:hypothetical protein